MAHRPTILWILALATACGGGTQRTGTSGPPAPTPIRFELGAAERVKLSPLLEQRWRAGAFHAGEYVAVIVKGNAIVGGAESAALDALGGRHVWPVTTQPSNDGAVSATKTDAPTDTVVVNVTGERLAALAALPWVARLEIASGHPVGPRLPENVDRRIGPRLSFVLAELGPTRPYLVEIIGEASGCFDEPRKAEMTALGTSNIWIGSTAPGCAYTIFSGQIALDNLVGLASLPWVVRIDLTTQLYPEDARHD